MKKLTSIIILIVLVMNVNAQNSNELRIEGQHQIDNLNEQDIPQIFEGDILISGDITDLRKFDHIIQINGSLKLTSLNRTTVLNGFTNLKIIRDAFYLMSAPELLEIEGFKSIELIGDIFWIKDCDKLTTLKGFRNLRTVEGVFRLNGNKSLKNIEGLNNLRKVKHLEISYTHLVTLEGISSLDSIRSIGIHENLELLNLSGLEKLSRIEGTFEIYGNIKLVSLKGLENLKSMGGSNNFYIRSNKELKSIEELKNLDYQTIWNFAVANNPKLCKCQSKTLIDYLNKSKFASEINRNGEGCSSKNEILNK